MGRKRNLNVKNREHSQKEKRQLTELYPCWLRRQRICLVAQTVKNPPAMWETWVWSLGWEDSLGEGMATHSSAHAWRISRIEEPGRLQSLELQRVGHGWATNTFIFFEENKTVYRIFKKFHWVLWLISSSSGNKWRF